MSPPDQNYPPPQPRYAGQPISDQNLPTGCIFDEAERDTFFAKLAKDQQLIDVKDAFPPPQPDPQPVTILYPFLLAIFPAWSYGLQGRGDCMAWSATHNVDVLMGVNIALLKKREQPRALASIEAQYGFMRVEVSGKKTNYSGDGGSPSAAAESVIKCGTLHRLDYETGPHDLRFYDETGGRSGTYGRFGVPDELEPIARQHIVQQVALVTDFNSAVQVLSRGIPISNADPRNPIWTKRDQDGFGSSQWRASHAMNYIGYRLGDRPGLLKINTGHGNHVSGPMHPADCPVQIAACAAWEDADTAEDVLKSGWSWAYSDYTGFAARELASDTVNHAAVHPNQIID